MDPWNCCRTCLGVTSLNPIFPYLSRVLEANKTYNEALLVDGLKIKMDDELPQEICTPCIDTINNFMEFKKSCRHSYKILSKSQKKKQLSNTIKTNKKFKAGEGKTEPDLEIIDLIDKSFDVIELDNDEIADEHDYCDNINDPTDNIDDPTDNDVKNGTIEFEATLEEILKKHKPFKLANLPSNFISNLKIKTEETDPSAREFNIEVKVEELQSKDENVSEKVTDDILEPYECQTCHKVYKNKFSYLSHRKIHDGMKVVCEHCGKSFLDKRRLLMHCKAKHGYQKTDKCSFCDYTGASKEAVKIHERLHTGEKPYVCEVCSASFHRKSSYLQHKPIHLEEKTVPCDLCPSLFKSVTLMRIHKTKHKPREYKHKCLICGTNFGKRWHCLRHLQRIHGVSEALDNHLERCDLCPSLFKSVTLMRIHKTKHKPREYKHKCLICGTNFGKRWHCLRHLQRIHGFSEALDNHLERVWLNDI